MYNFDFLSLDHSSRLGREKCFGWWRRRLQNHGFWNGQRCLGRRHICANPWGTFLWHVLLYQYPSSWIKEGTFQASFFFLIFDYRAVFRLSGRQLRLCLEMVHILLRVMCEFVLSFRHSIHKQSSKYHQDILIIFRNKLSDNILSLNIGRCQGLGNLSYEEIRLNDQPIMFLCKFRFSELFFVK